MVQHEQKAQRVILEPDSDIVGRAQAVAARIKERAPAVDRAREIPVETVREFHEAGLLTLFIPRSQGGTEADLITQLAVFEIIGGACASTGWCLANHTGVTGLIQGIMGERSTPYIQAVVEEGAALAFGLLPAGTTGILPGGFVVTGRWPFVSFSSRARWAFLNTLFLDHRPIGRQRMAWPGHPSPISALWRYSLATQVCGLTRPGRPCPYGPQ
jgi:alkylation response protein AidB-like acyl-CoA dehydrogenase